MANGFVHIPYNPANDPNFYIAQALSGLGQGLGKFLGGRQESQDIQQLGGSLGMNLPQFQSPVGRNLALQNLMQASQPITPFQQASLAQGAIPNLRAINTGEVTSIFNPQTGQIDPTIHPSSRVPSTNVTIQPSAGERTAIAETRASIDSLDNLKNLFDSTQTTTGPIAGRVSPTKGLFGLTTDEQEAFMAATSAFKNSIIKEITGAQMSEVEAKRIMKQIPDITDPPTRWRAKWQQSKKNLEFLQKRRLEILGKEGIQSTQTGINIPIPDDIKGMTPAQIQQEINRISTGAR